MSSKKPAVSIRKPPAPVDPGAAERFVAQGSARPTASAPTSGKRSKALVERRDGRELRRMTIYLPPELARQIGIYAAHKEQDTSGAIADICSSFLATWKG